MTTITKADVEQAALDWLECLGWAVTYGPDIAPDTSNAERSTELPSHMRRTENELA